MHTYDRGQPEDHRDKSEGEANKSYVVPEPIEA